MKTESSFAVKRVLKVLLFPLVLIRRQFLKAREMWYARHNPKKLANIKYKANYGKDINWDNPKNLYEKINWMKFNTDLTEWARLSDKYLVREYVKERGREDLLINLLGVWERAEDIDFDNLPNSFVLKSNHGSGTVLVVHDKSKLNIPKVRKELNKWLGFTFGIDTAEPHYMLIKPLLLAEELLTNDCKQSTSLVDYKVWCLNGKPYCFMICANRVLGRGMEMAYYDMNWKQIPEMLTGHHKNDNEKVIIDKPKCLPELIKAAEDLSKGHPEVRVDFYVVNDRVYFGEMTFTSYGAYENCIAPKYLEEMGSLVTLPEKKSTNDRKHQ